MPGNPTAASSDPGDGDSSGSRRRGGRDKDALRGDAILTATIDVLADVGFDRMTVEMVVARAGAGKGAVYRRWQSKTDMVLAAVDMMKRELIDLDDLPDTGTLRGDLLALFPAVWVSERERLIRAMAGVATMLSSDEPTSAGSVPATLIEPWVHANQVLISRAIDRGEASPVGDGGVVPTIIPSMAGYRVFVQRQPITRAFVADLVDQVVLPSLRVSSPD